MYCCTVLGFGDMRFPGRSVCPVEGTDVTLRLDSRLAVNRTEGLRSPGLVGRAGALATVATSLGEMGSATPSLSSDVKHEDSEMFRRNGGVEKNDVIAVFVSRI